jgi:hypothetical protein
MQKRKMQKKVSKKHSKFWCFLSKIGLWRFVEALKSVENDTEIPVHLRALFPKFREHFQGFSGTFNLESGKISEKRRFRRFGKIFTFAFTGWRSTAIFYMGRKSELRFFSKSAEHVFGFGSDFVLLRENPSDENDDAYRLPYRPVAQGVSFPYAFLFRFRL